MSRYIDAEIAYDKIAEQETSYYMDMEGVQAGLDETPTVDAVLREELNKLAKKVSDMREAQKRYFKCRSLNDLTASKQLEAEVDAIVKAILDPDMTLF